MPIQTLLSGYSRTRILLFFPARCAAARPPHGEGAHRPGRVKISPPVILHHCWARSQTCTRVSHSAHIQQSCQPLCSWSVGYIKRAGAHGEDSAPLPAFLLSSHSRPRKSAEHGAHRVASCKTCDAVRCGTKTGKRHEDRRLATKRRAQASPVVRFLIVCFVRCLVSCQPECAPRVRACVAYPELPRPP